LLVRLNGTLVIASPLVFLCETTIRFRQLVIRCLQTRCKVEVKEGEKE
jgi:hypothetical protein